MEKRKDLDVKIVNEIGEEETVKIYVVRPNNNTIKNADRYRAKIWNQCLMDGVLTKKELGTILEKRGIWSKDKEDEQDKIISELTSLEKELYIGVDGKKKSTLEEGKNLAIKMRRLRIKLRDLISERIELEDNTAESLADNSKFDYFVADCTYYANGEKVYKDVEDYNSKSSDEIAFSAAQALGSMIYQLDNKFEESLPENKWLKKFDLVNEELSLVDKDGNLIDTTGKKITKDGFYLNENGQRIDNEGNLLEEDGTYVIQLEYEDTSKPKKATKSKKTESTTESEENG